jgi:tripartite-type tricarboxylate transporter receptor subunit TctC
MKLARRRLLQLVASTAAVSALPRAAAALDYPTRPLRFIVGLAPGGGSDTVARIMANWLTGRLGQSVVVENKPGASTNISIQATLSAPADGYTLVFLTSSSAINATLFTNLPFNLLHDIAPVAGLIDFPLVLVINPALPVRTLADFIAYARDDADRISMASYGTGSTSHMAIELFKSMTGLRMVHVPYRGESVALPDIISGQVQGMFATMTSALPLARSGAVRMLAVAGRNRSDFAPDVPPVGETVPGYEAYSWSGVGVARGTPPEIVTRLNAEINAGLMDPATRDRLAAVSTTPIIHTPESFGAFMAGEVEKWGKVIKAAGIRLE